MSSGEVFSSSTYTASTSDHQAQKMKPKPMHSCGDLSTFFLPWQIEAIWEAGEFVEISWRRETQPPLAAQLPVRTSHLEVLEASIREVH